MALVNSSQPTFFNLDTVKGVIFDYGGVLVFHHTTAELEEMAALLGLSFEQFNTLYWEDRVPHDKGLLSAEGYWENFARCANVTLSPAVRDQLVEIDVRSWMHFDQRMYDFAAALKEQGKRIAVLSNMPEELGEELKKTGRGLANFDHLTLSYEVGSAKPEPEIYHHCLAGINLPAAETLFLDDRLENVKAAQKLGIHAIQFTSAEEILPLLGAEHLCSAK